MVLFFSSVHSNSVRPGQVLKKLFYPSSADKTQASQQVRWGTKTLKLYILCPWPCVSSQRPGPIIHHSFPYLSLHRMKDKQKLKSSWLAWCFCVKALLLSRPSLHPVPTSLQPWPYIIFRTQCSSSSSLFTSSLLFSTSARIKHS